VAWGHNASGPCDVPAPNANFVAVAAGVYHSLGLRADGSIVAWGYNGFGQCNVPAPNADFVAVAAGFWHSLGLKTDGSIVAWGRNNYGQCNVPAPNANFAAVAGGWLYALGLKADGSIVAWGRDDLGQCDVPAPNADFLAIAAGYHHGLGLKANGSIVAWGYNNSGQCNVPAPNVDFVAIAGGHHHSLSLKADGSIVAWGHNYYGQCNVPGTNADFVAVGGGAYHSLGLKADGSIVAWGDNYYGQCNVPGPNTDFVAVAAGVWHNLALRGPGVAPEDVQLRVTLQNRIVTAHATANGDPVSGVEVYVVDASAELGDDPPATWVRHGVTDSDGVVSFDFTADPGQYRWGAWYADEKVDEGQFEVGTLMVRFERPLGETISLGEILRIHVAVMYDGEPATDANIQAKIYLPNDQAYYGPYLHDDGTHGDEHADDGVYSYDLAVPLHPEGGHYVYAYAKRDTLVGSAISSFNIAGNKVGVPEISATFFGPHGDVFYRDDPLNADVSVACPSGEISDDTNVWALVKLPGHSDTKLFLDKVSDAAWQLRSDDQQGFRFAVAGQYTVMIDVRHLASLADWSQGYVLDVYEDDLALAPTVPSETALIGQAVSLSVQVQTLDQRMLSGASVTVRAGLSDPLTDLGVAGESDTGLYETVYAPAAEGEYTVEFEVSRPPYAPGSAAVGFSVGSDVEDLAQAVRDFAEKTTEAISRCDTDIFKYAALGDYFLNWYEADRDRGSLDSAILHVVFSSVVEAGVQYGAPFLRSRFPGLKRAGDLIGDRPPFSRTIPSGTAAAALRGDWKDFAQHACLDFANRFGRQTLEDYLQAEVAEWKMWPLLEEALHQAADPEQGILKPIWRQIIQPSLFAQQDLPGQVMALQDNVIAELVAMPTDTQQAFMQDFVKRRRYNAILRGRYDSLASELRKAY